MKDSPTKTLLIICITIAVLAAVGFGLGAWYVSGQSEYTFTGNVSVEGVAGGGVSITVPDDQLSQSVVYGSPKEAVNGGSWLYSDGEMSENLRLVYDVTFSGATENVSFALTVTATDEKEDDATPFIGPRTGRDFGAATYKNAVEGGYIAGNDGTEIAFDVISGGENLSYQQDGGNHIINLSSGGDSTARLTVTFSWGEKFGGVNPYEYYTAFTEDNVEDFENFKLEAADTLEYLSRCMDGVAYAITFTRTA